MGLYNFQARFVQFVLDGSKNHTIRAERKHPDKPGNTLYLYTGLRTKKTRLLMRAVCTCVEPITINPVCEIFVNGQQLSMVDCSELAFLDGFRPKGTASPFRLMMEFWQSRLPFQGHIIHWRPESHV